jgi:hypothetical protein
MQQLEGRTRRVVRHMSRNKARGRPQEVPRMRLQTASNERCAVRDSSSKAALAS